jgi:hypothetical protein
LKFCFVQPQSPTGSGIIGDIQQMRIAGIIMEAGEEDHTLKWLQNNPFEHS